MKTQLVGCLGAMVLALGTLAAQDSTPTKPDNSKMNAGDGQKTAVTADQQKMQSDDRHMTQQIRKALIADKSLSMYGHNVKIISRNGKVTLKGPVRSDEEKTTIASKAVEIAGSADEVDNQLTVVPASK